jgi:hypothetical protein
MQRHAATLKNFSFPAPVLAYLSPMFVRFGHALLIVALIAALGGHWAVLQTVAWTNMLAHNLRTDSLENAVTKTFNGKNPCNLCKAISAGKKAETKSQFHSPVKKLEFVSDRPVLVFSAPSEFSLMPEFIASAVLLSYQPPVPPPRQLPA